MPLATPYARLRARVEAWPLVSEHGFENGQVVLGRSDARLAEAFAHDMRLRSAGMSLHMLDKLRELAWFPGGGVPGADITLDEYVTNLARQHLELDGTRLRLRWGDYEQDGRRAFERARHYRWLTLMIPGDLLAAAASVDQQAMPLDDDVTLVTPGLRAVLDRRVAQSHLHVGASLPFALLWTAMIRRFEQTTSPDQWPCGGIASPFGSPHTFRLRLVQAALLRLLMGSFLAEHAGGASSGDLTVYLSSWLSSHPRRRRWAWGVRDAIAEYERVIAALESPARQIAGWPRLLALYRVVAGSACARQALSADDLASQDPLARIWPCRRTDTDALPETRFAHAALRWIAAAGERDASVLRTRRARSQFARLFWQYQRIRGATFAYVVEEPGTSGLDWFTKHYERIGGIRGKLDDAVVAVGLAQDAKETHLESFEVRTSPEQTADANRRLLKSYARQAAAYLPAAGRNRPEFGVVLHFVKSWQHNRPDYRGGAPSPGSLMYGRHSRWFVRQLRAALGLRLALLREPRLLVVLRGIDICNVELAVGTWALAPLYATVRDASQHACSALGGRYQRSEVSPMRATCHVGEEYRRLIEGVRRMHEVVEFGVLQRGDRAGHGLALADDPLNWAQLAPTVAQPREDRLDDLLWEMERYARGDLPAEAGRLERVREEIRCLARDIYAQEHSVEDLRAARQLRHDRTFLSRRVGYPYARAFVPHSAAEALAASYLLNQDVFRRGHVPIEVPTDAAELRLLSAAQAFLRNLYARLEIAIESNPSSNLVVGDYSELAVHPAFRMRPLRRANTADAPTLRLSINTDDPITFSTRLADEYAHLYYALLSTGATAEEALEWLDGCRESGWQSRFTLPVSRECDVLRDVASRWR